MIKRGLITCHKAILMLCAIGFCAIGCGDGADTDGIQPNEMTPDAAAESDGTMMVEDGSVESGDAQAVDTDAGLIEPDADVHADASVESNDAETDITDGAVIAADMAVPVQDAVVVVADMAVEATDAMTEAPDAAPMPTNQMRFAGCRLNDTWSIDVRSVPPLGQGCQNGGGVALGDQMHEFRVTQGEGEQLVLDSIRPPLRINDYHVFEVSLIEENDQCRLIAFMENAFTFVNDEMADGRTTQVVLRFDYDMVVAQNGVVTGTGFSTDRFQAFPDENNLDQSTAEVIRTCTEPLIFTGQVNP